MIEFDFGTIIAFLIGGLLRYLLYEVHEARYLKLKEQQKKEKEWKQQSEMINKLMATAGKQNQMKK